MAAGSIGLICMRRAHLDGGLADHEGREEPGVLGHGDKGSDLHGAPEALADQDLVPRSRLRQGPVAEDMGADMPAECDPDAVSASLVASADAARGGGGLRRGYAASHGRVLSGEGERSLWLMHPRGDAARRLHEWPTHTWHGHGQREVGLIILRGRGAAGRGAALRGLMVACDGAPHETTDEHDPARW